MEAVHERGDAAARRGRLPAPLDLPVVREPAEARARAARRLRHRYPANPHFVRCAPAKSRIEYFHDAGASLGVWQALVGGRRANGRSACSRKPPGGLGAAVQLERARGDRSRHRRAATRSSRWRRPGRSAQERVPGGCVARCWIGWDSGRPPWTPTRPRSPTSRPAIRTASPTRRAPAFAPRPTRRCGEAYRISLAGWRAFERGALDEADAALGQAASRAPRDTGDPGAPRADPAGARRCRAGAADLRSQSSRPARAAPPIALAAAYAWSAEVFEARGRSSQARARIGYRSATHVLRGRLAAAATECRRAARSPRRECHANHGPRIYRSTHV